MNLFELKNEVEKIISGPIPEYEWGEMRRVLFPEFGPEFSFRLAEHVAEKYKLLKSQPVNNTK